MMDADGLSSDQLEQFKRDGFLVIDGFFSVEEVEQMRQTMHKIVEEMNLDEHPKSIFTTDESQTKFRDDYFMTSGDKIRFFFEQGAFSDKGELITDKHKAINKVGHALHAWNPVFKQVTFDKRIQAIVKSVGFRHPVVPQSMYIFKQPGIGGEVTPHRDSTFLYTDPPSALGLWIPLEDCTLENGCLQFVPSSQNDGIERRFIRNPEAGGPLTSFIGPLVEDDDGREYIPQFTRKGCLVLIHGTVLHKSAPNKSEKSRHAYTFHIIEQENTEWSKQNWLQPTEQLPFPPLYSMN